MIGAIRVKGLDKTLARLNGKMKSIRFKNKKGLIQAGLLVQRGGQMNCPVDLGNLKASGFTVWGPSSPIKVFGFKGKGAGKMGTEHARVTMQEKMSLPAGDINPVVEVGFSAFYALYVHEKKAKHIVGDWKFLERSLNENQGQILGIVSGSVKI